ncbi:hypothetical protein [Paenibacillus sp. FSL H3-0333]|uniref:hypothetical protein n=1 Tax=Paenibacillus sp. FSL H3-0333 TaxID=2921373 RepID=UPI0030FACC6F
MQFSSENQIEIHSNGVAITVEGESEIFGGVDLQLKAAQAIIENMDFKFAHEHKTYEYSQMAYIQIIDSLGRLIQMDGDYPDDCSNIEAVKLFLDWVIEDRIHETPKYAVLLSEKR